MARSRCTQNSLEFSSGDHFSGRRLECTTCVGKCRSKVFFPTDCHPRKQGIPHPRQEILPDKISQGVAGLCVEAEVRAHLDRHGNHIFRTSTARQ